MSISKAGTAMAAIALSIAATPTRAGSAVRGAQLYAARCSACHSIDDNGAGPRHRGLFGRAAGSVPAFAYSQALKQSGIVWTTELVDRWLADPNKLVPGNIMVVQLSNDPRDRADLIAYLLEATKPSP